MCRKCVQSRISGSAQLTQNDDPGNRIDAAESFVFALAKRVAVAFSAFEAECPSWLFVRATACSQAGWLREVPSFGCGCGCDDRRMEVISQVGDKEETE